MCLIETNSEIKTQKRLSYIPYAEWSETRMCFTITTLHLGFRIFHQEGQTMPGRAETGTHQCMPYADDVNLLGENVNGIKRLY
jgi:hypothetical protein